MAEPTELTHESMETVQATRHSGLPAHLSVLYHPPRDYLERLIRLARCGDVVRMFAGRSVYLVNDPAIVKIICQTGFGHATKDSYHYRRFAQCLGPGMVTLNDDAWRATRERCQQGFWPKALPAFDRVMTDHMQRWFSEWSVDAQQQKSVVLCEQVMTRVFALTAEILLGVYLSWQEAQEALGWVGRLSDAVIGNPLWDAFGHHAQRRRDADQLDAWLMRCVHSATAPEYALLSPIFAAFHQGEITQVQCLGELKNILFASFDTTSLSLTWGMTLLAMHPGIQRRTAQAAWRCEADATGLAIYQQCAPIRCLIQEALRLYPSAFGLERRLLTVPPALQALFKPNDLLRFSPYLLQRHPKYWQHPDVFWPERFAKGSPMKHRYAYCPFILGPRNCIGQHLANAIMAKVYATLLPTMAFVPTARTTFRPAPRLTLRPPKGMTVQLRARVTASHTPTPG